MKLDSIDLRILEAVQRDGRITKLKLAEVAGLSPTPLGTMHLTGRLVEITGRKAVVDTDLSVGGVVTAKGSAVLVEIPEDRWQASG